MTAAPSSLQPETRVLVVIPVYNHAATLRQVAEGCLAQHAHVLVVDDGSSDLPFLPASLPSSLPEGVVCADALPKEHPLHGLPLMVTRHSVNRGKGKAIMTAAHIASAMGMTHIITIDADGQHSPKDLPVFIAAACAHPHTIFVGARDFTVPNVPSSSRFGRKFSNFWFKVQTAHAISDSQCGFRLYPLAVFTHVKLGDSRYSFEVEVLVRSSWAGFAVADIPIDVYYPPRSERVSHFRAFHDNVLISLLNTRLTMRAFFPWPHKRVVVNASGALSVLRPMQSLRFLLGKSETPRNLAYAAALGMVLGTLPLPGLHSILIVLVATHFRLHALMALAVSQLCMPPFVPAMAIELGYYLRFGVFLTEISWRTLGYEFLSRVYEWCIGGIVLAPVLGAVIGGLVYILAYGLQRQLSAAAGAHPQRSKE